MGFKQTEGPEERYKQGPWGIQEGLGSGFWASFLHGCLASSLRPQQVLLLHGRHLCVFWFLLEMLQLPLLQAPLGLLRTQDICVKSGLLATSNDEKGTQGMVQSESGQGVGAWGCGELARAVCQNRVGLAATWQEDKPWAARDGQMPGAQGSHEFCSAIKELVPLIRGTLGEGMFGGEWALGFVPCWNQSDSKSSGAQCGGNLLPLILKIFQTSPVRSPVVEVFI